MIELSWRDRVAVITLDRSAKHNALNIALCHRIRETLDTAGEARAIVACSKRIVNEVFEPEFDGEQAKEFHTAFEACWASEDFAEGRRARTEKRPAVFRGR